MDSRRGASTSSTALSSGVGRAHPIAPADRARDARGHKPRQNSVPVASGQNPGATAR